ncbi:MAG: serine/threonine protein kinase [Desulfonatronovibrionaceae bacterium]
MNTESARDIIQDLMPSFPLKHCRRLVKDTTDFTGISYGDVIELESRHFLVLRDEAERRFGMEDPKFWVKRCRVLETGSRAILKLVFHEKFNQQIGPVVINCYRSPEKESRILDLVRGDGRFMQGETVRDEAGNPVRIIEVINGKSLDNIVEDLDMGHEQYFHEEFPEILQKFLQTCQAIGYLHNHGEKHGDIRRDHIFVERGTRAYRWIDFDYAYESVENPFGLDVFGLGGILLFAAGKGVHESQALAGTDQGGAVLAKTTPDDFSLLFPNRLVNLKTLFPYIPESLNRVLMHFSRGTCVAYETVPEMLEDLEHASQDVAGLKAQNQKKPA